MANPGAFGDPDHYSRRYLGTRDNGGVHTNSGIPNHAFYLAIEGGTNRTSGLSVTGVGGANREQIEKVFYRAFAFMLPANATFSTARAATIQAARDLYGATAPPSARSRRPGPRWGSIEVAARRGSDGRCSRPVSPRSPRWQAQAADAGRPAKPQPPRRRPARRRPPPGPAGRPGAS